MTVLFIVAVVLLCFPSPTDYSRDGELQLSQSCAFRLRACEPFSAPRDAIGLYKCRPTKSCVITCTLTCPEGMSISTAKKTRKSFICTRNGWRAKTLYNSEPGYCYTTEEVEMVKQNFHHNVQLNELTHKLLNSSYLYLALAVFYERADVALPGLSKMMMKLHREDSENAVNVMSYINKRGGYVKLCDVPRPDYQEKMIQNKSSRHGVLGVELALSTSRYINNVVHNLRSLTSRPTAVNMRDPHLKKTLEEGIITQKTNNIKKLADLASRLGSFSNEDYRIGEYEVDQHLMS